MTSHEAIAARLLSDARTSGGATLDPNGGESPTSGYAVAYPYMGISFPDNGDVDMAWIQEMVRDCAAAGYYVGSWKAPHGVIFIDAVEIVADRDEAIEKGLSRTELAIYDIEKDEEITLNY